MLYEMLSPETRNAIVFSPVPPPTDPRANYPGFQPEKRVIPAGFQKTPGAMAAPCDILFERDVPLKLRDGTQIYVDIFRPVTEEKIPVILNSTIFGKAGSYMNLGRVPNNAWVQPEWVSGFQSFEAAEPFFWCGAGYAVVNIDMRGIGMSQGDSCYFGSQDATDNYDIIEHFGTADWSNGRVSMAGNSWLAITQWYVAAMNPPHLTCIAPWEGHGNMYEDEYMRGGIPNYAAARVNLSYGMNKMEDLGANMRKFPLMNEYWEDKYAKFEQITCPAYVVASYTSNLHTHGTFEGFRKISSKEKWLRVHNTQEWPDLYNPKYANDLKKFFDHYMKDIDNGWENTPRVRVSILDPGHGQGITDRPEADFPIPNQPLKKLYLDASDGSLKDAPVKAHATFAYEGNPKNVSYFEHDYHATMVNRVEDPDEVSYAQFTVDIEEETEILGYIKAKLWMEVDGHDDMDVYVRLAKLDAQGNVLYHDAVISKFTGPGGILRASHRELDPERSTICEPYHPHKTLSYLSPGEVVPLEIGIWPVGQVFHKGEKLRLYVAGYNHLGERGSYRETTNFNRGRHIIHTGGKYDSHLILPITKKD